jgi:hypothetical protein
MARFLILAVDEGKNIHISIAEMEYILTQMIYGETTKSPHLLDFQVFLKSGESLFYQIPTSSYEECLSLITKINNQLNGN